MSLVLKNSVLLREACFAGDHWIMADGAVIAVTNLPTDDLLGHVPDLGVAEERKRRLKQHSWVKRTEKERSNVLRSWFYLMVDNQPDSWAESRTGNGAIGTISQNGGSTSPTGTHSITRRVSGQQDHSGQVGQLNTTRDDG